MYGPTGMLQQQVKAEGKGMRQSPKRVAELVLRAMHHRVLLCWIVQHPILLLGVPMRLGLQLRVQELGSMVWGKRRCQLSFSMSCRQACVVCASASVSPTPVLAPTCGPLLVTESKAWSLSCYDDVTTQPTGDDDPPSPCAEASFVQAT